MFKKPLKMAGEDVEIKRPNYSMNEWRNKIEKTLWIIVLLIFFVEIVVFFISKPFNELDGKKIINYLLEFVLVPSFLNILCLVTNKKIQKSLKHSTKTKNYSIVIAALVISFVVAFTHYVTSITLSSFVVPVFMTTLYADKRITRNISLVAIVLVLAVIIHSTRKLGWYYFFINIFAAYIFLIASCYLTNVFIDYIRVNKEYICESYAKQLELFEKTRTDSLTNLYNQQTFMQKIQSSIEDMNMNKKLLCVVILDVDNFKAVNDTYGHLSGNQVLVKLSELLLNLKGNENNDDIFLSRYGGEEFCLIIKDKTIEEVYEIIESVRIGFSNIRYSFQQNSSITFSAGITEYREGQSAEDIFNNADKALYQAKNSGKNKTLVL